MLCAISLRGIQASQGCHWTEARAFTQQSDNFMHESLVC